MHIPWPLSDAGGNSEQQLGKHVGINANIAHVVAMTLPLQFSEQRVVLSEKTSAHDPGLDPPSSVSARILTLSLLYKCHKDDIMPLLIFLKLKFKI